MSVQRISPESAKQWNSFSPVCFIQLSSFAVAMLILMGFRICYAHYKP